VDLNFHGTETQLERYALERLTEPDLSVLEEHLLICSVCQDRLNEIEDFAVGMQEALGGRGVSGTQHTPGRKVTARTEPARTASASAGTSWFAWLRAPAFSLAMGALVLIGAVAVFSGGAKLAPVASLQLTANRGEMPVVAPAREFDLTLDRDSRDTGPFRAEVVDATGHAMWKGPADNGSPGVRVKITQRLKPGVYFVRLYSGSEPAPREFGFRIR